VVAKLHDCLKIGGIDMRPIKGLSFEDFYGEDMALALRGKMSKALIGHKVDIKTKKKISKSRIGHTSFMLGKTKKEIYGEERAKEIVDKWHKNFHPSRYWLGKKMSKSIRKKMSNIRKGKTYEEIYGKEKAVILRKMRSVQFRNLERMPFSEETKNKMSKFAKRRFKNKENHPMFGKHLSDEAKKRLSDFTKKRFENKENCPMFGKHHSKKTKNELSKNRIEYFKTHPPTYPKKHFVEALGHGVRSSWEEKIAFMMKDAGISYGYETTKFDLNDGSYLPDFEIST
jgi:hypothetical protein